MILKSIRDVEDLANDLLDETGLTERGWIFRFNKSALKLGSSELILDHTNRIVKEKRMGISEKIMKYNLDNPKVIQNVILHEIAHCIDFENRGPIVYKPEYSHDDEWAKLAKKLGCDDDFIRTVAIPESINMPPMKWKHTCNTCGKEIDWPNKKQKGFICIDCCNKYAQGKKLEEYRMTITKNY